MQNSQINFMHRLLPKTNMDLCSLKVSPSLLAITDISYMPGWEYIWLWVIVPTVIDPSPQLHIYSLVADVSPYIQRHRIRNILV